MLQNRITGLKKEIIEYGALIEEMVTKSIAGLLERNETPLKEVIDILEPATNDLEIKIDDLCTTTIAQYEPRARDLRVVLMIFKMNSDLERMGDHVANIADSGLFLISHAPVKPLVDIPRMAEETIKSLNDAITSFIDGNAALAQQVCERDSIIDALQDQIFRELVTFMSSDPATIERALHLIRIANNLERVADLSTNICEDVIFMVEGRVIKHHFDKRGHKTRSMDMDKIKVLFVCSHNSARSQMAEGFLNNIAGDRFQAESAGMEPGTLNPLAVEVMKEAGIDISRNKTKSVFEKYNNGELFSYVITVCAEAETCPIFPGLRMETLHWHFEDPATFTGTHEEKMAKTRRVRDAIREKVAGFIEKVKQGIEPREN